MANGFTLEIHDRGLGMAPEVLLDANLRLAETPDFELSDTDRLGLFVVSRLAQRQNVRVSLQISPYGGTTAVVFIPAQLLTDAPDTHGTGFRLDRRAEKALGGGRPGSAVPGSDKARRDGVADADIPGRPSGLSPVPTGLTDPSVLDGPVELEGPVGTLGFTDPARDRELDPALGPVLDGVSDLEDTESERGGIFRARDLRREADREQHQQAFDAPDGRSADVRPMRPAGPVPLPRRKPPTLVADQGRRIGDGPRSHRSGPGGFPAAPGSGTAEPAPVESPADEPRARPRPAVRPSAPDTVGGLPRRVRQANLAPQLREDAAGRTSGHAPADTDDDLERDADDVRNRMASLQRGWQRGRRQNAAEDATGPGETAPGTTPGGDGR